MSRVSIIGLGDMARGLGVRARAVGHAVEIIGHDPAGAAELAAALDGATAGAAGAAPTGDIVILTVPYGVAVPVVSAYAYALAGKVIIDATNPVNADLTGLVIPDGSSGAQEIAKAAPQANVVKAFNTVSSTALAADTATQPPLDVFIAGDDPQGKALVAGFIESLGLRSFDGGSLPMARALEHVGLLQRSLAAHSTTHNDFVFGVTILS
jgi:predicted dinucleotide-binding enzyme